jgi:hypothetical protein
VAKWKEEHELDGGRWVPKASSRPDPRTSWVSRKAGCLDWWPLGILLTVAVAILVLGVVYLACSLKTANDIL